MSAQRYGFASPQRLHQPGEFKSAYARGRRFADARLTMHALLNNGPHARLGLSVAARLAGNAVQRNRIKRQVRESFRQQQHELPGLDIVVGVRAGVRGASQAELRASLTALWQQIAAPWRP